jgi:hypothetical protein
MIGMPRRIAIYRASCSREGIAGPDVDESTLRLHFFW